MESRARARAAILYFSLARPPFLHLAARDREFIRTFFLSALYRAQYAMSALSLQMYFTTLVWLEYSPFGKIVLPK